jgi:hypothetical protein
MASGPGATTLDPDSHLGKNPDAGEWIAGDIVGLGRDSPALGGMGPNGGGSTGVLSVAMHTDSRRAVESRRGVVKGDENSGGGTD